MSETEIREAIAEQEEYLKRRKSCEGVLGRAHQFRDFGAPSADGTIKNAHMWRECFTCGVTETPEDYQRRRAART